MRRLAYTLALYLLLPYVLARLLWRARRQPAYLGHLGERFGGGRTPAPLPLLWIHAVSVGETRAAQPLVAALLAAYPDHQILLSHGTPTGRATSKALFGGRVLRAYLPWDLPFAVARFLARNRPVVGILMETELWPNLIAACRARGIPLLLANARLSERSAARYRRFAGLSRAALAALAGVAAQTEADARRLSELGARDVEVLGNLKFDVVPPAEQLAAGQALRAAIGARPVLLCASTREGEEAAIVAALAASPLPAEVLLLVVPRHPQRFDEVARLFAANGLALQRRSQEAPVAPATRVLLGDSMGEMFAYYAAADVAFVGGSLLPLGGQNLIEACAMGRPVLVGPHTFNFADATEQAIAAGAALRVADAADLARTAARLLADGEGRARMGAAGERFAARHRGATQRTLAFISRAMR